LIEQSIGNGRSYRFQRNNDLEVEVTDPQGERTRVTMEVVDHKNYYTVQKIAAANLPYIPFH